MITIYPENLKYYLLQKKYFCYFLFGNEKFLIKYSTKMIIQNIKKEYLFELYFYSFIKNFDLNQILLILQKKTLFSEKTIICIKVTKALILKKNNQILNKLSQISTSNVILIIYCNELIFLYQKQNIFDSLKSNITTVDCNILNIKRLKQWIQFFILKKNIKLEKSAIKILVHYYYGNTLELMQIINLIYLIWPNQYIKTSQLKNIINDAAQFSVFQWINAIFNNDKKKSIQILEKLLNTQYNPLSLVRALQNNLIALLSIIRNKDQEKYSCLYENKMMQYKHITFTKIHLNIHIEKIHKFIQLLSSVEITIKTNNNTNIWNHLKNLSLI